MAPEEAFRQLERHPWVDSVAKNLSVASILDNLWKGDGRCHLGKEESDGL